MGSNNVNRLKHTLKWVHMCRELNRIPNPWETKKIEKTHAKEKQSHTQDSIYVVRQFAYVHGVAGISLLSGKNTEYNLAATIFSIYI